MIWGHWFFSHWNISSFVFYSSLVLRMKYSLLLFLFLILKRNFSLVLWKIPFQFWYQVFTLPQFLSYPLRTHTFIDFSYLLMFFFTLLRSHEREGEFGLSWSPRRGKYSWLWRNISSILYGMNYLKTRLLTHSWRFSVFILSVSFLFNKIVLIERVFLERRWFISLHCTIFLEMMIMCNLWRILLFFYLLHFFLRLDSVRHLRKYSILGMVSLVFCFIVGFVNTHTFIELMSWDQKIDAADCYLLNSCFFVINRYSETVV